MEECGPTQRVEKIGWPEIEGRKRNRGKQRGKITLFFLCVNMI